MIKNKFNTKTNKLHTRAYYVVCIPFVFVKNEKKKLQSVCVELCESNNVRHIVQLSYSSSFFNFSVQLYVAVDSEL